MGVAWRVVDDDGLVSTAHAAAAELAALDPGAVAATKALVNDARTDAFRAAHQRELAAMRALRRRDEGA